MTDVGELVDQFHVKKLQDLIPHDAVWVKFDKGGTIKAYRNEVLRQGKLEVRWKAEGGGRGHTKRVHKEERGKEAPARGRTRVCVGAWVRRCVVP